jgi:cob(I)alamin adenosyltransferase
MKIYTRAGDFGKTSTILGEKVSKASRLIELQGSVDEVNSSLGYLRALIKKYSNEATYVEETQSLEGYLKSIQYVLFCMGADITNQMTQHYIKQEHVEELEVLIDQMTEKTGQLKSFIYLSGHETACYAHVLRSTTRRAERNFVAFLEETNKEDQDVPLDYKYLNRLADYFYQVARYLNYLFSVEEEQMHL